MTVATALDALPSGVFVTLARNNSWIQNVFQPIMELDPKTGKPKPVLATKWQFGPGNKSIVITLRDDVTFHTGRKMTADDVKFSFQQAAKPAAASNLAFVAKAFTGMTVVSPTELKITFSSPQPSLFDFFNQTRIVDKDTYAGLADGSKVVGTGPFTFSDWKPGASFTLKKYAGYWDAADVNLDSIEYVVTTNATAELSAIRSGRAQLAWGLTATDAQSFAKNSQYQIVNSGGTIYPLGMNVTIPPFNNPQVRQAVAYALDSNRVNQQVFAGNASVSDLFWAKGTPGVDSSLTDRYNYNLDKAKQMIQGAGASGARVQIEYGANPVVRAMYEIVANNLTAIGLSPTPKAVDQPTFSAGQSAGNLGAAFIALHVASSPVTMLQALPTLRKGNPSHFWTPEYQQLRKAFLTATSDAARTSALQKLSTYMLDQAFILPIVQAPDRIVVASSVQNVSAATGGSMLLEKAYVTK